MAREQAGTAALTVVVAPAGSGKSHHVRARVAARPHAWLSVRSEWHHTELAGSLLGALDPPVLRLPNSLAGVLGDCCGPEAAADPLGRAEQVGSLLGRLLEDVLHRRTVLVVDRVESIGPVQGCSRLLDALVRAAPSTLEIVLVSREGIPFPLDRLGHSGSVQQISEDRLLLSDEHAAGLLAQLDVHDPSVVNVIVEGAGGNPGALIAASALQRRGFDQSLRSFDAPCLYRELTHRLHPDEVTAVRFVAYSGALTATQIDRCEAQAGELLQRLARERLITQVPGTPPFYRLPRLMHEAIVALDKPPRELLAARMTDALTHGDPERALQLAIAASDSALIRSALTSYGCASIPVSAAAAVLRAVDLLPEHERRGLHGLAGRAAYALGDWERARQAFDTAARSEVIAADAWRHGLIEYLQGDPDIARLIYTRGVAQDVPGRDSATDRALLAGYAAAAAWLNGDQITADELSAHALSLATQSGDDQALAAAHTAASLVAAAAGDRLLNDSHYAQALHHAEQAADTFQIARIRSNRGSRLMESGEYVGALTELDQAVECAAAGGYGAILAIALCNRGEVMTKLGRLDEALADLSTAVDLLQSQGSRLVAYPLCGLARLHHTRGHYELARAHAEQALSVSDGDGDRQIAVIGRIQLARALAVSDPSTARCEATAAASLAATSVDEAEAWAVSATLALQAGETADAAQQAEKATRAGRARGSQWGLAVAMEVVAATTREVTVRNQWLWESRELFASLGCAIDAARVELELLTSGPAEDSEARLDAVADLARRLGCRPLTQHAEQLREELQTTAAAPVRIGVLGTFRLWRHGELASGSAWQSKKARDLVRMLAVRHGIPLPRDVVLERLWPGEESGRSVSRLSVLLSTARAVLDPDRQYPGDHFIKADGESVCLDLTSVECDLEEFIRHSRQALGAHRASPATDPLATSLLARAESDYLSDVLADDLYTSWYVAPREEARASYLAVAAALAQRRGDSGDLDDAIAVLLRLIEREPYDEPAHLHLVRLLTRRGRHGDARRGYQRYAERMREIDIDPSPFPREKADPRLT